eukprot:jgi/Astpho2/7263/e_gw1.00113.72.1_t
MTPAAKHRGPRQQSPSARLQVHPPSIYDEPTKSLSVVIPAYNEQDRLPSSLDSLAGFLERLRDRRGPNFTYEIIIVDDGSQDNTLECSYTFIRRKGFETVRAIDLQQNHGKGHAVRAGMMIARGEQVLMADADGATRWEDLELLQGRMQELLKKQSESHLPSPTLLRGMPTGQATGLGPLGMVVGSRAHLEKQAMAKRNRLRNFLTKGFHFLVLLVAGGAVRDTQCGFKLLTRRTAKVMVSNQRLERWCFDVELIYLAQQLQIPVEEVQVHWTEVPGSKIRSTSILHMAWELLALLIGYKLLHIWRIHTEVELQTDSQ